MCSCYGARHMNFLSGKHISYVLLTRINSHFYDTRVHINGHLYYHDRLIRYGKRECDNFFLYLFEDQDIMLEERKTLYRRLDDGKIDKKELRERMKKAGKILIISNLDVDGNEIYDLYKGRELLKRCLIRIKLCLKRMKCIYRAMRASLGTCSYRSYLLTSTVSWSRY